MITHVVLFKLKERDEANIAAARDVLRGLEGKVPTLRQLEVGIDVLRSERSYDLALVARFDDLDGLQAYQVHPAHVPVLTYLRAACDAIVAVDYES